MIEEGTGWERDYLADHSDIPFHDVGPRGQRPGLALVAGMFGRELNGEFVLARVAAFLKELEAGRVEGGALKRRVVVVPAARGVGRRAGCRPPRPRLLGKDLRLMEPPRPGDDLTQAVAALTAAAGQCIAIYSSGPDVEELPLVCIDPDDARSSPRAAWFGLPRVLESPRAGVSEHPLCRARPRSHGERYWIRAGQAGCVQYTHCSLLLRALVDFLRRCDVIDLAPAGGTESESPYLSRALPLVSGATGMFVSSLSVGTWVAAGELLGQVYDGYGGRVLEDVTAPDGGLLTAIRRQPLVRPADLVARIHVPRPASGGVRGEPARAG